MNTEWGDERGQGTSTWFNNLFPQLTAVRLPSCTWSIPTKETAWNTFGNLDYRECLQFPKVLMYDLRARSVIPKRHLHDGTWVPNYVTYTTTTDVLVQPPASTTPKLLIYSQYIYIFVLWEKSIPLVKIITIFPKQKKQYFQISTITLGTMWRELDDLSQFWFPPSICTLYMSHTIFEDHRFYPSVFSQPANPSKASNQPPNLKSLPDSKVTTSTHLCMLPLVVKDCPHTEHL